VQYHERSEVREAGRTQCPCSRSARAAKSGRRLPKMRHGSHPGRASPPQFLGPLPGRSLTRRFFATRESSPPRFTLFPKTQPRSDARRTPDQLGAISFVSLRKYSPQLRVRQTKRVTNRDLFNHRSFALRHCGHPGHRRCAHRYLLSCRTNGGAENIRPAKYAMMRHIQASKILIYSELAKKREPRKDNSKVTLLFPSGIAICLR